MYGDPRGYINARVERKDGNSPLGAAGTVIGVDEDEPFGRTLRVLWVTGVRNEKPSDLREL